MRARYVIAIIAIAILAVGSRLFLVPPESEAFSSDAGLNIQQVRKGVNVQKLPDQQMHDMSLVFDHNTGAP
jgi:hypothetical protein